MKITSISISNIKGFKGKTEFNTSSSINLFVGKNNSGKSTILKSIYRLQNPYILDSNDTTLMEPIGELSIEYIGPFINYSMEETGGVINLSHLSGAGWILNINNGPILNVGIISDLEPHNLIYPFLSNRKVEIFETAINENNKKQIGITLKNLYIKLDSLLSHPVNQTFINNCKNIIGFEPTMELVGNGKKVVHKISNTFSLEITKLGDGIPHIIGFLADLTIEKDKIFVIEELENDIHPSALKKLLDLVIESSKHNQFFISTHSNIVLKRLGCEVNTKIFHITNNESDETFNNLKISQLKEVGNNPYERREILEDLGYEFNDSDFWKAWLLLEESSAETIINKYLIPWFVPKLSGKLRTFSTNGFTNAKRKFKELQSTFVFIFLEPIYKDRTWVFLDAGDEEAKVIEEFKEIALRNKHSVNRFSQFSKHDFEEYYPIQYIEDVDKIKNLNSGPEKQKAKKELLLNFINDIDLNEDDASQMFETNFSEIINLLKEIEKEI